MRFSFYLLMALSLAACSSESTPPATTDAAADVSADQPASDTPAADVAADTTPADVTQTDAATDSTPADVATDSTPADVATDSTPADVATDATPADAATDATPADAATDATPADAATDAGSTFMAFAPCNAESDYRTTTVVSFGGTFGSVYSTPCVTLRAGSSLMFSGSFGGHPLRPSTRGSASNPIPSTDSGSSLSVTFPAVGYYPYYCNFHGTDSGSGMAGVVRVIP